MTKMLQERNYFVSFFVFHIMVPILVALASFNTSSFDVTGVSGLADSVPKSEMCKCKLQPTDFVRGNVDLKTNGGYLLVIHVSCQ